LYRQANPPEAHPVFLHTDRDSGFSVHPRLCRRPSAFRCPGAAKPQEAANENRQVIDPFIPEKHLPGHDRKMLESPDKPRINALETVLFVPILMKTNTGYQSDRQFHTISRTGTEMSL